MAPSDKPGLLRRGLRRLAGRGRRASPRGPAEVRFEVPRGAPVTVEVPAGTTLLHAALDAGVDLSHYCGGTCSCGTCRVEVRRGGEHLTRVEGREQMVLGYEGTQAGDRLACQARVQGPVTIAVLDNY